MRSLVIMFCAALLGGCVSNSDDPCEKVWSDVGEADGKLGFAGDRVAFHQTQCGEKVDVALWEQGRQKGLAWYCRPEHLYLAGRSGEEYRGYLFTRTGLTASVLPGWDNLSSRCTP